MYNKKLYDLAYKQAIIDAKKNLQGEELEKCLTALKNFMINNHLIEEK